MGENIQVFQQSLVIMAQGMFGILLFMSFFYGLISLLMKWGARPQKND